MSPPQRLQQLRHLCRRAGKEGTDAGEASCGSQPSPVIRSEPHSPHSSTGRSPRRGSFSPRFSEEINDDGEAVITGVRANMTSFHVSNPFSFCVDCPSGDSSERLEKKRKFEEARKRHYNMKATISKVRSDATSSETSLDGSGHDGDDEKSTC